eukprot:6205905-Pleurochrysis_carterae.AAC.2
MLFEGSLICCILALLAQIRVRIDCELTAAFQIIGMIRIRIRYLHASRSNTARRCSDDMTLVDVFKYKNLRRDARVAAPAQLTIVPFTRTTYRAQVQTEIAIKRSYSSFRKLATAPLQQIAQRGARCRRNPPVTSCRKPQHDANAHPRFRAL